ncbi:hypothetical protein DTO021C3_7329 [Paecilomyces variotii]|nr:hypothetical protein DTO195F2_2532 [Paecilomyces variotii]KAJ9285052.1 hypothetical protein DTO021C3_7329 [Paecilomyces variotii]
MGWIKLPLQRESRLAFNVIRWREEETQIFFIPATFSFTGNSSHLPRSRASSPSPSATATSSPRHHHQ